MGTFYYLRCMMKVHNPETTGRLNMYAYTDASGWVGDPGHGGLGVVLVKPKGEVVDMAGVYIPDHRVGRLELLAVFQAVHLYRKRNLTIKPKGKLVVYTDSQYVQRTYTIYLKEWVKDLKKFRQKKHYKLWEQLYTYRSFLEIRWMKGHNGHLGNEMADFLAGKCRKLRTNI